MEIDWMFLTYLMIGGCALVGFFRGWWKEALTSCVLALLLVLLQRPDWAQQAIDILNAAIATIWELVVKVLGLTTTGEVFQFDATQASTWIALMVLLIGLAALIAHLALPGTTQKVPGRYYVVGALGRLLGMLLGALNGFLIINLLREYLDGRALPGSEPLQTEIAVSGSSPFGPASNTLVVQAVNLPSFTILDSYIPWLLIAIGVLIFALALKNTVRVATSKNGGKKIERISPYGYKPMDIKKPPEEPKPQKVEVTNPS